MVRQASALQQGETVKSNTKSIAKNERRIAELDKILRLLYEDKALGKITEERYNEYADGYEQERSDLRDKTAIMQAELDAFNADKENAERFVKLIQRFTNFEELTPAVINEFVERIEVYEGEYPDAIPSINYRGERTQKVDVYLKYIGKFDAPVPPAVQTPKPKVMDLSELAKLQHKREQHRIGEQKRRARRRAEKAAAIAAQTSEVRIV
jgi:hypothetical protein